MVGRLLIIGGAALVAYFLLLRRAPAPPTSATGLVLDPHAAHTGTTYSPPATSKVPGPLKQASGTATVEKVATVATFGVCAYGTAGLGTPLCATIGSKLAGPAAGTVYNAGADIVHGNSPFKGDWRPTK